MSSSITLDLSTKSSLSNKSISKSNTKNFNISTIPLGSAVNAYSQYGKSRTKLSLNQESGVVLFLHRGNPLISGSSGNIVVYDYSTDHGDHWTANVGPVISGSINSVGTRYPQGFIYNPIGNKDLNNTRIIATAAYPIGTNNSWGGIKAGSSKLNGTDPKETLITNNNGSIPEALVERIPGEYYMINDTDANGNINLYKGVYNVSADSVVWSVTNLAHARTLFIFDADTSRYYDFSIAFSNDGQIGWIAVNGDVANQKDFKTESVFWKTIDGGLTWSGPILVNTSSLAGITSVFNNSKPSADNESSLIVDSYGNPHFVFIVGKTNQYNYDILSIEGIYLYDITLNNNIWIAKNIEVMQSYKGILAGTTLKQGNSPTVVKSPDPDVLFYIWTDTEKENQLAPFRNDYPDLFIKGHNMFYDIYGPTTNVTVGTSAEYIAFMPSICNVVSDLGNIWAFHTVIAEFSGDENYSVDFKYLDGFEIQFIGVENKTNTSFQISKNYPNPFSDKTSIDINLKKSSEVKITVSNLFGQIISSDVKSLLAGQHTLNINANNLASGMYVYTVNVDGYEVSDKMIVRH